MKQIITTWAFLLAVNLTVSSQLIVNHTCTDITQIPESAIVQAKQQLHIAYGHTSHGSQVTDGMTGLIDFANNGGRGLALPENIFQWNNGGSEGALDLHDYAMGGDVGYWPDWYNNTIAYLDDPANADVNVIMWSWCGQVGSKYSNGVLWDEFLEPMSSLENDYPEVTFVYMTGHLNYWDRENVNAANDSIRSYCLNNNKVLFDFADIESYSPDGTNYKDNADDACDYYNESSDSIGNWAVEYQNSHTQGVDWYACGSAHSEPLNANLKAYAAWWMFSSLAGWNYDPPATIIQEKNGLKGKIYPNPAKDYAWFEIPNASGEDIRVDLISPNGAVIESNLTSVENGDRLIFHVVTDKLEPSIYYLMVTTPDISESYRMLIIK